MPTMTGMDIQGFKHMNDVLEYFNIKGEINMGIFDISILALVFISGLIGFVRALLESC